jgi:hypothetical protein
VATNLSDWEPKRSLEWQREKAGSIEAVHDVPKNELGGGVLPSKRFGVDAAWFRLAVITGCRRFDNFRRRTTPDLAQTLLPGGEPPARGVLREFRARRKSQSRLLFAIHRSAWPRYPSIVATIRPLGDLRTLPCRKLTDGSRNRRVP